MGARPEKKQMPRGNDRKKGKSRGLGEGQSSLLDCMIRWLGAGALCASADGILWIAARVCAKEFVDEYCC